MRKSRTLLLATTAFLLALTGASYAHDGQVNGAQDWKGGQHEWHHPQFTEAQKDLLRDTMMQMHKKNNPLVEKLHQLRKEMFALTKADTFDQQAFLEKSSEAGKVRADITRNRINAFVAMAPQFSPEERKFLFKMTIRHHRRHHGHHHWRHHGDAGKGGWKQDGQPMQPPANAPPQSDAAPAGQ